MLVFKTYNKCRLMVDVETTLVVCFNKVSFSFSSSKIKRYSGTILSPNWPHPYGYYNFPWTNECEWDIQTGSNDKVVKLNFMDFDIYNTGSTGYCYNDKVLVRGILILFP